MAVALLGRKSSAEWATFALVPVLVLVLVLACLATGASDCHIDSTPMASSALVFPRVRNGYTVAAGDVTGDGVPEVGVASDTALLVGQRNSSGGYDIVYQKLGFVGYFDIAFARVDADAALDIVYVAFLDLLWVRNNGTGGFPEPAVTIATNLFVYNIWAVDLIGRGLDGVQDLVVVTQDFPSRLLVWRNSGTGTFAQTDDKSIGYFRGPGGVSFGNFTGEPLVQLAGFSDPSGFYRSLGNGSLSAFNPIFVDNTPTALIAGGWTFGDLDGVGLADAVAIVSGTSLYIVREVAMPGAAWHLVSLSSTVSGTIALADLNGDTHVDILLIGPLSGVWLRAASTVPTGNAAAMFPFKPAVFATAPISDMFFFALADLNADGLPDLLHGTINGPVNSYLNSALARVSETGFDPSATCPSLFAQTADFDLDGAPDLLCRGQSGTTGASWLSVSGSNGAFSVARTAIPADALGDVWLADLDDSGTIDIVAGFNSFSAVQQLIWLANDPENPGQFYEAARFGMTGGLGLTMVGVAELSASGSLSLIVVVASTSVGAFNTTAAGVLGAAVARPLITNLVGVVGAAVGEVTGSLGPDIVVQDRVPPAFATCTIYLYPNDGAGAFPPSARVAISLAPTLLFVPPLLSNIVGESGSPLEVVFGSFAQSGSTNLYSYFWWSFADRLNRSIAANSTTLGSQIAAPTLVDWTPMDGRDELLIAFNGIVYLVRNVNGSGVFAPPVIVSASYLGGAFVVADLNDDGLADLTTGVPLLKIFEGVASPGGMRAPTGVAAALLPGCAGTQGAGFSCLVARFETVASQCFPSTVVLPPVTPSCGLTPLDSGPSLELVTIRSASAGTPATIACPIDSGRTGFLRVGAGSSVALVDVTFALAANLSDPLVVPGVAQLESPLALCSSACGLSSSPARLSLTRVRMSDFVTAGAVSYASPNRGFGAVVVFGPSELTIADSRFERNVCATAGAAVSLVGAGASVAVTRTAFVDNTATGRHGDTTTGGGGGAIVLLGDAQRATIANCTFAHNAASGGTGGAIMVRATGGARLFVDASEFADNTAAIAGGALALAGSTLATAQLTRTSFERNAAGFGGAIAAFSSELAGPAALNPTTLSSLLPAGAVGTTGGGAVTLDAACQLGDSRASYGGLFFACAAFVNASAASVRPGAAVTAFDGGAIAFRCNALEASAAAAASWVTWPQAITAAQLSSRYGLQIATPPTQLALVGAQPPARVQSAVALGSGAVAALDAYGQRVAVPSLALRLALAADAPAETVSAVVGWSALLVASAVDATYALSQVALSARGWPTVFADAGALPVPLALAVDAGGVASQVAGSPVLAFTVRVTGCNSGWGRASSNDSSVPLVCAACAGGTYTTAADAASGAQCRVCPLNTVQQSAAGVNGTADTACVCKAGFYAPTGEANTACSACPAGGVCAGGTAAPTAAAGFFPDGGVFVACPLAGSCVAGGVCERGYTGRLCGKCARGFYSLNAQCRPCRQTQTGGVAVLLAVLALAVVAALFWFNLSASLRYKFVAAMLGFTALQVIALFGKLRLDWGPLATGFLTVASALSLNIQLASPECSLSPGVDAWTLKWALMLALPVFAALAVAAFALALFWPLHVLGVPRFRTLTVGSLVDAAVRTWYQILVLMQLPLTAAAMSPFGCRRDESGVAVLVDDPARVCYDARWWRLFAPALIFSLLYGMVLPGYVWRMLARARARLDPIAFTLRYGFLVARFEPNCYAGEIAMMAFKGALVLVTTFFATSESKVGAGALVVVGMFGVVAFVRPLERLAHNALAIGSLAAIAVVLVAGTLDATVLRKALASIAIVLLVLGLVLGNAFDLWQLTRAEQAAKRAWDGSDSVSVARGSRAPDLSGATTFADEGASSVPMQPLASALARGQAIVRETDTDWSSVDQTLSSVMHGDDFGSAAPSLAPRESASP